MPTTASQQFDTLDGLVVTGNLNAGSGLLIVDSTNTRVGVNKVPTTTLDVNGTATFTSVDINGGTVDGLTQLTVDNLTLNGDTLSGSGDLIIDAADDIILDTANSDVILKQDGTQYGALTNSSGNLEIKTGTTTAMTLTSTGGVVFSANLGISDGQGIDFGSVMDITASASGATFSANTIHGGHLVADGDTNTHLNFNAADSFQITTGGTVRLTANNTGVHIDGALDFDSVKVDQPIYEKVQTEATFNIDLNDGPAILCTATGGGTVAFTLPSSPGTNSFAWTVKFNNSGTITWPASVEWAEGVTPPVSSGVDIYSFVTYDGGTTIYGSLAIRNAS